MNVSRSCGAILTVLVSVGMAVSAVAEETLESLKNQFDWHEKQLTKGLAAFQEQYAGELAKLEEKAIGEGNLELVVAVRKEKEEFRSRKEAVTPSPQADLARLQSFYEAQSKRIVGENADQLNALVDGYRKQLGLLRDTLTKANNLGGAVEVQGELDRLAKVFPGAAEPALAAPSTPSAPPAVSNGELRASRAKVKALLVIQLEGSKFAGQASNLSASAIPSGGESEATVSFNQEVGDSMRTALAEVIKFHKIRYQGWPKGKKIEISFEDKYSGKDGPSAAVACALLLESMLSGNALDEMFAVTGDMNADGTVQPIGGVPAKIRGATRRTCNVVAIPKQNERALFDLVLSEGISPLLEIQVFTIATFDEALKLAKAERDPVVKASMDEFASIQEVFSRPGANITALLRNGRVQEKLQSVLKGNPNHLSALIMLAAGRGSLPKALSVAGSLDAIDNSAAAILRMIQSGAVDGGSIDALAGDELADAITKLRRNRAILDRRTWGYSDAIVDFGDLLRTWKDNRPGDPGRRRDLYDAIVRAGNNIDRQIASLKANREVMEELMQ